MEKLKVGSKLEIHCYKHNGKIHRTWSEAIVLDITDELLVCGNKNIIITEKDGRTHKTKEPAIIYFYINRWFNVFAQFKKRGLYFKANIASPYLIDDNIIKFIDYDLDLKVFPDGTFKVLDCNEYKYHKVKMKYSENLDKILNKELEDLIHLKKRKSTPFDKEISEKYLKKYIEMTEKGL